MEKQVLECLFKSPLGTFRLDLSREGSVQIYIDHDVESYFRLELSGAVVVEKSDYRHEDSEFPCDLCLFPYPDGDVLIHFAITESSAKEVRDLLERIKGDVQ